jgi:hypothetical protein
MSKQGGYENAPTGGDVQTRRSSKSNLRHVIWITGMLASIFIIYFKLFCFATFDHVQVLLSIYSHLNYKQQKVIFCNLKYK